MENLPELDDDQMHTIASGLIESGLAVSLRQATQIVMIMRNQVLPTDVKMGLLAIAHARGDNFELTELTEKEIEAASDMALEEINRRALLSARPMGSC